MNKILLIAATNRPQSLSRIVAEYYLEQLQLHSIASELLALENLPPNLLQSGLYANKGKDRIVQQFSHTLQQYEKHVWVVPEYNGSIPGVLKVLIDALTPADTIKGKKIGLIGVSAGYRGNLIGLSHFNDILVYLGAYVHPIQPALGALTTPTRAALEANEEHLKRIEQHLRAMISY